VCCRHRVVTHYRPCDLNERLMPLHKALFIESNPIPVKWALHEMGMIPEGIRLPLTWLSSTCHEPLRQALRQSGVLVLKSRKYCA
jgi:4-hydroxy-tetrahydrodipicolinate synthase